MASCDSRGIKNTATNIHEYVLICLAIGYRDSRADCESVTFFLDQFRRRTDRISDEGTGMVAIKNSGACESVTFFSAPFRSRTDRISDEGTGMVPIKNSGAGRTSAPRDDPQVWREKREAQRQPVTVAGPGTRSQRQGSRSGKSTRAAARRVSGNNNNENQERKASGTAG